MLVLGLMTPAVLGCAGAERLPPPASPPAAPAAPAVASGGAEDAEGAGGDAEGDLAARLDAAAAALVGEARRSGIEPALGVVVEPRDPGSGSLAAALEDRLPALGREVEAALAHYARVVTDGAPARRSFEPSRTHCVRVRVAEAAQGTWTLDLQLEDDAGAILAVYPLEAREADAPLRSVDDPLPVDPVALTRALLQAALSSDGATIAAALHPDLEGAWRRRATARAQSLPEYAAAFFADPPLATLGQVTGCELHRGRVRCEVDVTFEGQWRDVDFVYRWAGGRWRLAGVEDYR